MRAFRRIHLLSAENGEIKFGGACEFCKEASVGIEFAKGFPVERNGWMRSCGDSQGYFRAGSVGTKALSNGIHRAVFAGGKKSWAHADGKSYQNRCGMEEAAFAAFV
jgi:hypothetical protein